MSYRFYKTIWDLLTLYQVDGVNPPITDVLCEDICCMVNSVKEQCDQNESPFFENVPFIGYDKESNQFYDIANEKAVSLVPDILQCHIIDEILHQHIYQVDDYKGNLFDELVISPILWCLARYGDYKLLDTLYIYEFIQNHWLVSRIYQMCLKYSKLNTNLLKLRVGDRYYNLTARRQMNSYYVKTIVSYPTLDRVETKEIDFNGLPFKTKIELFLKLNYEIS